MDRLNKHISCMQTQSCQLGEEMEHVVGGYVKESSISTISYQVTRIVLNTWQNLLTTLLHHTIGSVITDVCISLVITGLYRYVVKVPLALWNGLSSMIRDKLVQCVVQCMCIVLWCTMQCSVLCSVVQYVVQCSVCVLYCIVVYHVVQCIVLYCGVPCSVVYCIVLWCSMQCSVFVLCCDVLCSVVWCIVQCCVVCSVVLCGVQCSVVQCMCIVL